MEEGNNCRVTRDATVLTLEEVRSLCARIADVVRQRDELAEQVQHWQQVMAELTALRALLAETPGETVYSRVATNGHIAHRGVDTAGEASVILQVTGDDADEGLAAVVDPTTMLASMPEADDLDSEPGDVPSVEPPHLDADLADCHRDDTRKDGGAIPMPESPEHDATETPNAETESEETASDPTAPSSSDTVSACQITAGIPASETPVAPALSSTTPASSPPVEAGGKPPAGTLLARILDLLDQSSRPKRPWQIQKELGLPRVPSAELSRLVGKGYVVRLREGVYGVVGRDYT
jgi:hypothetical protein